MRLSVISLVSRAHHFTIRVVHRCTAISATAELLFHISFNIGSVFDSTRPRTLYAAVQCITGSW